MNECTAANTIYCHITSPEKYRLGWWLIRECGKLFLYFGSLSLLLLAGQVFLWPGADDDDAVAAARVAVAVAAVAATERFMAGKLCAPLCRVGFGYLCVFTPLPTLTGLNVCLPRCLLRCLKSSTSTMRLQHGHMQQTVRWCFSDFQCNSPVDQGSDGGESNRSCCWWRDGAGAARCPVTKTASVAAADLRARAQSGLSAPLTSLRHMQSTTTKNEKSNCTVIDCHCRW